MKKTKQQEFEENELKKNKLKQRIEVLNKLIQDYNNPKWEDLINERAALSVKLANLRKPTDNKKPLSKHLTYPSI